MADQNNPGPTNAGSVQNMMPKTEPAKTADPPQATDTTPPRSDATELGGSDPTPAALQRGNQVQSRGEPLASANARTGLSRETQQARKERLLGAMHSPHLAVRNRLHSGQQDGFHYHWFGDDGMRIEYGQSLGYEFADAEGNASSEKDAARSRGLIKMRVREDEYRQRKDRINRVVNPKAERAARDAFVEIGEQLDPDTKPMDNTRSRRGPFSQEVRRHDQTGLLQERERDQ